MKKLCGYKLNRENLAKIAHLKGKPCYEIRYMRLLRRQARLWISHIPTWKKTKVSTTRMVGKFDTTYIVYISYWRGLVGMGWVKYDRTQNYYLQLQKAQNIAWAKTNYPI